MKKAAIDQLNNTHSIRACCRALDLSRSAYYEVQARAKKRKEREAPVVNAIKEVRKHRFKRHYGSPRMSNELRDRGFDVGRHQTARLMRQYDLGAAKKKRFVRTTDSKHDNPIAANILNRQFDVGVRERVWVGDITYLRTPQGWLYMAAIVDLGTRKWVGFSIAAHMEASLVNDALNMALLQERDQPLLMHSDRGSQYASGDHRDILKHRGITMSMSRKGNCWDNAVSESFFATFKNEAGDMFLDEYDTRSVAFDYFNFYNRERRHSTLGNISPTAFEQNLNHNIK